MEFGYKRSVALPFLEAVEKTRSALAEEGFGVLTEIDAQTTLKKKLDADIEPYIILGACNPPFAHQALTAEKDIGLLLPCNVIVYEEAGTVYVAAIKPTVAMRMVDNLELAKIAATVEAKLQSVVDAIVQ